MRQKGEELQKNAREEAEMFLDIGHRAGTNIRENERRRLENDRENGKIDLTTPDDDLDFFAENVASHNQAMTVSTCRWHSGIPR